MVNINGRNIDVDAIDLNLLRVLLTVMHERSITVAGTRLGLTQSATSAALNRLRQCLNDPLFVRTQGGMEPTRLAVALAGPVADALGLIRDAIEAAQAFDPATSTRRFHLLMTDVGEVMFLPPLTAYIQQHAPHIHVACRQLPRDQYGAELEAGAADLALGMLPHGDRNFVQQRLRDESLVAIAARGNAAVGEVLTMDAFLSVPHVAIRLPAMGDGFLVKALGARANERRIAVEVQHYLSVPMILRNSNFIAVVPQSVAACLAEQNNLRIMQLPCPILPLEIRQFWHERWANDPGHRWLRNAVAELFKYEMPARPIVSDSPEGNFEAGL